MMAQVKVGACESCGSVRELKSEPVRELGRFAVGWYCVAECWTMIHAFNGRGRA